MWRVIGLMLAALFVGTNANVIIPVCPVISHEDEVHYLASDETSTWVTLTEWKTISGEVESLDCGPYVSGKRLQVALGECDIECKACEGGACCTYKYLLTVKVGE
ncbi:uncharacterized protein LOC115927612 [Strongylocentrotus purpuratus]|uniref:Uncharacterized protein n=1 Tax=Strongylocentrotus purpuratus TaxID=7668 RepID=A0A7M7PFI5_STRPU|nr:uncharacterized protein LOC115927612 [Strongylocentrotus purpuratus]